MHLHFYSEESGHCASYQNGLVFRNKDRCIVRCKRSVAEWQ